MFACRLVLESVARRNVGSEGPERRSFVPADDRVRPGSGEEVELLLRARGPKMDDENASRLDNRRMPPRVMCDWDAA